jgi:hypothetical protein
MNAIGIGIRIEAASLGSPLLFPEDGTHEDFKHAVLDELFTAYCAFCGWPDVSDEENTMLLGCRHCPSNPRDVAYDNRTRQLLRDQDVLDE